MDTIEFQKTFRRIFVNDATTGLVDTRDTIECQKTFRRIFIGDARTACGHSWTPLSFREHFEGYLLIIQVIC